MSILVVLILVNVALFTLRRSLSEERAVLVDAAATLSRDAAEARVVRERERELSMLVEAAREATLAPDDIGELRDLLVSAERRLQLDRLSLDFRPEEQLAPGFGGSRIHASLRGAFDALYQYLARVERMFLPLALENLTLRGEGTNLRLTVQWAARWPLEEHRAETGNKDLTTNELSRLSEWLSREPPPRPDRDLFAERRAARARDDPAPVIEVEESPLPESTPHVESERPVLTGFVLARPELEPDVGRRVLAALRYRGELRLVTVGERIGAYVVDSMEARDSVTLENVETGDRIHLTLP